MCIGEVTSSLDSKDPAPLEPMVLSVVIPIFNETQTIPELWRRLQAVLVQLKCRHEVIFVDDGSTDETPHAIQQLCHAHPAVRYLRLSRNFGHQPALTAGLDHAQGQAVILMDGDLQDAPESIPTFMKAWQQGAEVVYAVRSSRKESAIMQLAFRCFYRLLGQAARIEIPLDAGIFGLLDHRVVNILKGMPERHRYFPGLRAYAGFRQVGIPVQREGRYAGKPRVGIAGLFALAMDALFSFSFLPLRLATLMGLTIAFGSFCYLLIVLYYRLFTTQAMTGWASMLGAVLFLGGIQLVVLGLVGEYIGRIYEESKRRPYYIIADESTPSSPSHS